MIMYCLKPDVNFRHIIVGMNTPTNVQTNLDCQLRS